MKYHLSLAVRIWLSVTLVGTGLLIFGYTAVQQSMRLGANDPQWEMAHDGASRLANGTAPSEVVGSTSVELKTSLAPFTIVTDRNHNIMASSGHLNNVAVLPPNGSFAASLSRGSNWFTWQPASGIREATVIMPYGGAHPGYILVARSLSRVEQNIDVITRLALLTLIGIVVVPTVILAKTT